MAYRNDVDALAARHAALATQAADLAEKRDEAARMLEEARAKARLPILDNLRVASPCSQKWADMKGDDRARECAKCEKQVFNLSALTRDEAEGLIREKNGKLCVRYFQRADGTIMLADCDVGRRRKRVVRVAAAAAIAGLAGGAAAYLLRSETPAGQHIMGDIAEPPPTEIAGGISIEPPPVPIVTPPAAVHGSTIVPIETPEHLKRHR